MRLLIITIVISILSVPCLGQDKPVSGETGKIPMRVLSGIDTLRNISRSPKGGLWHNGRSVFWVPADTIVLAPALQVVQRGGWVVTMPDSARVRFIVDNPGYSLRGIDGMIVNGQPRYLKSKTFKRGKIPVPWPPDWVILGYYYQGQLYRW